MIIDAIAHRYHVLPSEVMARADTLDYVVMDVAQTWHNYQQEKAMAKSQGRPPPAPPMPLNKLQDMMERVKR